MTRILTTVKQLRDGRFNPIVLAHAAGEFVDELRDAGILTGMIPIMNDLGKLSRNRIFANPLSLIRGISELPNFSAWENQQLLVIYGAVRLLYRMA